MNDTQKRDIIAQLSSGLMHDISTHLTVLNFNLQNLDSRGHPRTNDKRLLKESLQCIEEVVRLMRSAKSKNTAVAEPLPFQADESLLQVLSSLNGKFRQVGADIAVAVEPVRLLGDELAFRRLVLNVLVNAAEAVACEPYFKRHVEVKFAPVGTHARLTISDTGVGIPPQDLQNIFNRGFSTKLKDSHSGVGLALVKEIVENDFAGKIQVESRVGGGSTFRIDFYAFTRR